MPGSVFEQVFDHPPEPVSVAGDCWSGLGEVDVDGQVGVAGAGDIGGAVGDVAEVDLGAGLNEAGFAAGEALQPVDESVHPLRLPGHDLYRKLPLVVARVRRACDVEVGADGLQWGAQLMSSVGGEPSRRDERLLTGGDCAVEAGEHPVEFPRERGDLGRLSWLLDTYAEVFGVADVRCFATKDLQRA